MNDDGKPCCIRLTSTTNYHQSYPPGNKSISHLWKKEKSSPTQKKGYVPKRRPTKTTTQTTHHKKQDQNQFYPWWCKLSKKFPTGPSKYERVPFINRVPLRVPGVSSGGNSTSPCLAGVQGNAAEEHRRAAEWTAKLAAENRRKLKGGGESFHPTTLVLQELGLQHEGF